MEMIFKDIETHFGKGTAQKCRDVTSVVRAKIIAGNYFGWRSFLDDLLVDLIVYMMNDKFIHSSGAYVACGMQSAIDHCRFCSAAKRRNDYEMVSLDDFFQVEDIEDSSKEEADRLLLDISIRWGKELAEKIEPFARGYADKLEKDVLAVVRSPEFVEWFKEYTRKD